MAGSRSQPTIRQIAKESGVSVFTVSAVLNNRSGEMSEETRERVLKVVRELGYRPTKKMQQRDILTVGVISGMPSESIVQQGYQRAILDGVMLATDHLRTNFLLFSSQFLYIDPHQSIRVYCDDQCDGLLLIAPRRNNGHLKALQERGYPCVLIGENAGSEASSYVDIDNFAAARVLTEYLIEQGHQRIAFLGNPADNFNSVKLRWEGYQQALIDHQLPLDPSLTFPDVEHEEQVYDWLRTILQRANQERPTALFAWHDAVAVYAYRALQRLALRVPSDISLVGFNDIVPDPALAAFLTTVRQPYTQISQRAVEILIAEIRGTETAPRQVILPYEIVIRDSVSSKQR